MADFITKFENLSGTTVGERKKSLYSLLKDETLKQKQDEVIKNLIPKTFLESLFRIDILIYLHRIPELIDILKEGNDIFVSKAIKQDWLFKEAFNDISIDDFVNECLPAMSYSVRMKVLKKLSRSLNEEKMNELFDAIMKRYGLFLASNFLAYCSVTKIDQVLKKEELRLHAGHLQCFFNKDPNLVLTYIDQFNKQGRGNFKETSFLKYVAERNLEFFLNLKIKYGLKVKVGTRTSKKIIDLKRDDVIANPHFYTDILKPSVIPRKLQKDFKQFYMNLHPNLTRTTAISSCNKYLAYAPKKIQYKILADTYKQVFEEDLEDNDDWMADKNVLNCLMSANPETCERWAKKRYDKSNDNDYLKYLPPSKSIPILKEKINLTSNLSDRSKLVELMVEFCKFHKDLKTLEVVMTYFCKRHRNDDRSTRSNFLYTVVSSFDYEEFNDTHWNCLLDLTKVQKMRDEFCQNDMLVFHYMEYLHRNNRPFKEYLDIFVQEQISQSVYIYFRTDTKYNSDVQRILLLELVEQIPLQLKNHMDEDLRLISYILNFNKKHPDKAIDLYSISRFVTILRDHKPDSYDVTLLENIEKIICKFNRNTTENDIMNNYFKNLEILHCSDIFKWFFKYDMQQFAKHFDQLLSYYTYIDFMYQLRKYNHLKLDEKLANYLLQQLKSEQKAATKISLVKPLVQISSPSKFVSIAEQYVPKSEKVDLEDEEERELYNLQCEFAKKIKYTSHMSVVLPTILKFCVGDYLASSLQSLYSAFYRVPENRLAPSLECLSKRAVSVRKHSLFLSCNILEQIIVIEKLKKFGAEEKNVSLQKHLFSAAIGYFTKNPSDNTWDLVKVFINFIDKSDTESLKNLSDCKVQIRYQHMFWVAAWEYFDKNKKAIPQYPSYMAKLLDKANKNLILKLPLDLSKKIVKECFLNKENAIGQYIGILKFTIFFLLCENRTDPFKLVFDLVAKYKADHWKDAKDNSILDFFSEFISFKRNDIFTTEAVVKFGAYWESIFTPIETFKQYIILKVLKIYKENEGDLEQFSKMVTEFIEEIYTVYGPFIVNRLAGIINYISGLLLKGNEERVQFVKYLLKYKTTIAVDVLVLQNINSIKDNNEDVTTFLQQISGSDNISLQILYNLHMRRQ